MRNTILNKSQGNGLHQSNPVGRFIVKLLLIKLFSSIWTFSVKLHSKELHDLLGIISILDEFRYSTTFQRKTKCL